MISRALLYLALPASFLYMNLTTAAEPGHLDRGQIAFNVCAVCHLQSGEGVTGVFPPLRNRLAGISASPLGREYLISVLLQGLNGPMVSGGVSYQGYMQAYPHFQDDQISSVLNYIALQLNDQPQSNFILFTKEEVAKARRAFKSNPTTSLEKRNQLNLD